MKDMYFYGNFVMSLIEVTEHGRAFGGLMLSVFILTTQVLFNLYIDRSREAKRP